MELGNPLYLGITKCVYSLRANANNSYATDAFISTLFNHCLVHFFQLHECDVHKIETFVVWPDRDVLYVILPLDSINCLFSILLDSIVVSIPACHAGFPVGEFLC